MTPVFATAKARGQNQKELIAMIEAWLQSFPSDEAALKALADHRVPAGPVLSIEETVSHPYFIARKMVRQVPDQILGEVTIPGFPVSSIRLSRTNSTSRLPYSVSTTPKYWASTWAALRTRLPSYTIRECCIRGSGNDVVEPGYPGQTAPA